MWHQKSKLSRILFFRKLCFYLPQSATYIICELLQNECILFPSLFGLCELKVRCLRVNCSGVNGVQRLRRGRAPSCLVAVVPRLSRRGALTRCGLAALANTAATELGSLCFVCNITADYRSFFRSLRFALPSLTAFAFGARAGISSLSGGTRQFLP